MDHCSRETFSDETRIVDREFVDPTQGIIFFLAVAGFVLHSHPNLGVFQVSSC